MISELFESGVHTENSDIRAHVGMYNRAVYVFKTAHANKILQTHGRIKYAGQAGVGYATGKGKVVPWNSIEDIRELKFHSWPRWDEFNENLSTSQKGKLAVDCVIDIMRLGRFPLWLDAEEDQRENIQIKGTDILLFCRKKIQVKCDALAGPKPKGTGNIFLQIAEVNPLSRY
jgi:hypothetical protein